MLIIERACDTIWILHLFKQGGMNTQTYPSIAGIDQSESESCTFGCSPLKTGAPRQLQKSLVSNQGYKCRISPHHSQKMPAGLKRWKVSPEMFWGMKILDLKLFDENFLTTGSTVRGICGDRWEWAGAEQVLEVNDPCKGKSLSCSQSRLHRQESW